MHRQKAIFVVHGHREMVRTAAVVGKHTAVKVSMCWKGDYQGEKSTKTEIIVCMDDWLSDLLSRSAIDLASFCVMVVRDLNHWNKITDLAVICEYFRKLPFSKRPHFLGLLNSFHSGIVVDLCMETYCLCTSFSALLVAPQFCQFGSTLIDHLNNPLIVNEPCAVQSSLLPFLKMVKYFLDLFINCVRSENEKLILKLFLNDLEPSDFFIAPEFIEIVCYLRDLKNMKRQELEMNEASEDFLLFSEISNLCTIYYDRLLEVSEIDCLRNVFCICYRFILYARMSRFFFAPLFSIVCFRFNQSA